MSLKFKPSETVKMNKGYIMMESVNKGKFTRDKLNKTLQTIADESNKNSHNFKMGVTYHYKNSNAWAPAIFRYSNESQVVWDPKDSPDTENLYDGDYIDEAIFWVVNSKGTTENGKELKYRKPKDASKSRKKKVISISDFK
jgi:hypothetical protein